MKKEKTFKDAEGMLYAYNRVKAEAKDIELEIEELNDEPQGITGKSENEIMQGSMTNKTSNSVEDEVIRRDEQVNNLLRIKRSKDRYVQKIENMITTLSEEEREFVELKYIKGKRNKDIEISTGLSRDGVNSKRKVIVSSLVDFMNTSKNTLKTH